MQVPANMVRWFHPSLCFPFRLLSLVSPFLRIVVPVTSPLSPLFLLRKAVADGLC
jgi:hypothetical protein